MEFHEVILNDFKVIERTRFCHRNWYLQSSKGNNSKLYIQELWFLHSAGHLMLVNISMKFHEDVLNRLKVWKRTQFCQTATYKVRRGILTLKIYIQELWFVRFVCRLMLVNIHTGFHEDTIEWFSSYRADTIFSVKLLLTKFKGA